MTKHKAIELLEEIKKLNDIMFAYQAYNDALNMAIEALKAQEPRVMSLEEMPYAVFGWMEASEQLVPCVLEDVYVDDTVGFASIEDGHDYMCASDYGKTWRVWTSRPTDEQREATPWIN